MTGFQRLPSPDPAWVAPSIVKTSAAIIAVVAVGLAYTAFHSRVLAAPLMDIFPQPMEGVSSMIRASGRLAPLAWVYMVLTAGFVEEVIYHALPAHYFLARGRSRPIAYVVLTTACFIAGH